MFNFHLTGCGFWGFAFIALLAKPLLAFTEEIPPFTEMLFLRQP